MHTTYTGHQVIDEHGEPVGTVSDVFYDDETSTEPTWLVVDPGVFRKERLVPRIDEEWPTVVDSHRAVVVLSLGTIPDVPSSKVLKSLRRWASDLNDNGGRLFIAGVSPATAAELASGGVADVVGEDGILPATERVFGALDEAVARGTQWIAGLD